MRECRRRIALLERAVADLQRQMLVAAPGAVVRAAELARLWPVVKRSTWKKWLRDGTLPSHKVKGTQARFVAVADVEWLLVDSRSITGRDGSPAPQVANDDDEARHDHVDEESTA